MSIRVLGFVLLLLLTPAPVFAQLGFDFAVDSLRVDGNILGSGNPNGVADFVDEFNDGSLAAFPTSAFFSFSPVNESGGFLNLRSSDGANRFTPGFLTDNFILGQQNQSFLLRNGFGGSDIRAAFRADVPISGQGYGLQLFTFGTDEVVNIQVINCGTGTCVLGLYTGPPRVSTSVPVDLTGVQRIILRLVLDDVTNTVTPSFSINGGASFTSIALPSTGRVFSAGSQAAVSLIGSVAIALPAPLGQPGSTNQNQSGSFAEPVNTATGNYVFQRTDLAIPGRGLPVVLTRTYNSQDTFMGPLGPGWTHSFNVRLAEDTTGIVSIKWGDGHEEFYHPFGDGTYESLFAGVFSTLVKDTSGAFIYTSKNQTRYNLTPAGRLAAIVDRNGNTLSFAYDSAGNLATITDTVGRVVTLIYDASNRISQITDPIGRLVRYGYDAADNLASVTDPAGGVMTFAYDGSHRMTEIRDERGNILLVNTYDGSGRVATQTNGRGFVTTFAYGMPTAGDTSITDPRGGVTIHTHDASLRLTGVKDANGGIVAFAYDTNNNRTNVTDQNGRTTIFGYDGQGNVTSITDPIGNLLAFAYDSQNNLTSATNARGFTTLFGYTSPGNLTSIQDAAGNTTTFGYDGSGQLIRKTDARGNVTQYGYDTQGNLIRITDARGGVTVLAYDGIGRLQNLTDPNGHMAGASYDVLSRLVQIVDPLGNRTRFAYDAVGNLIEILDAKLNATRYAYDEINNLTRVTDALGRVTEYAYDANNNRTRFTNAKGNATEYLFDLLNQLTGITDPLGNVTTYAYDPAGNVESVKDANGTTNTFSYDANNRLAGIAYGDGKTVAYTYDANGNRAAMTDGLGTTIYTYDSLNRLVQIVHPNGTVVYGYDGEGNRTSLTYPDAKVLTYAYDALNRLGQVTDWAGRVTTYAYDAASNLDEVIFPNKAKSSYEYDAANRLVEVQHRHARYRYILDELGNRIQLKQTGSAVISRASTFTYFYDALSQLVAVEEQGPGQARHRTEYGYDPVGNRLSLTELAFDRKQGFVPQTTVTYSYDAADRLLQAGATTFTHDNNGNRLTETSPTGPNLVYTYDAANRLIQVVRSSTVLTYTYDGDGSKVGQTGSSGPVQFLNDVATALPVVLQEDGPEGAITYGYGLGLFAEEVARPGLVTEAFFYLADGLGSTVALADSRGRPQASYEYDAWGNLDGSNGTVANRFLFTAEERDSETGLYYLRARWYDPTIGRFLTKDPFGGFALYPQSLNRYVYTFNNPTNWLDRSGLEPLSSLGFAAAVEVAKELAGRGAEILIQQAAGIYAANSVIDPLVIGRAFGRAAAYAAPFLNIVVGPGVAAYTDNLRNPERDRVEKLARYSIEVTAGTLFTLGSLVVTPVYGVAVGTAYEANRQQFQDAVLYNPITNAAGGFLYKTLSGTTPGGWFGIE